jgi:hypothetical protein
MVDQPKAGDLRHFVHFQKRGDVEDGLGGVIPGTGSFETVFSAAAKITPARGGSEKIIAGRLAGLQTYYCTFRSHPAARLVDTSWQVLDARTGKAYQIKSPSSDYDQRNAYLDMLIDDGSVT